MLFRTFDDDELGVDPDDDEEEEEEEEDDAESDFLDAVHGKPTGRQSTFGVAV